MRFYVTYHALLFINTPMALVVLKHLVVMLLMCITRRRLHKMATLMLRCITVSLLLVPCC